MKLERHKNKETKLDDAANNNYTLQQDYYLVGAMILFSKGNQHKTQQNT